MKIELSEVSENDDTLELINEHFHSSQIVLQNLVNKERNNREFSKQLVVQQQVLAEQQSKLQKLETNLVQRERELKLREEILQQDFEALDKEKKNWNQQQIQMQKYQFQDNKLIELNVGGKYYTTTVATLKSTSQDVGSSETSLLAAMVSGQFSLIQDKEGRFFIDRNGKVFGYILNFLRNQCNIQRSGIPLDDNLLIEQLCVECDYYGLEAMKRQLLGKSQKQNTFKSSKPEWLAEEDWKSIQNLIQEHHSHQQIGTLLYKASRDGLSTAQFQHCCHNKGPTLCILKSKDGNIFGGYNHNSWKLGSSHSLQNWTFCLPNKLIPKPTSFKVSDEIRSTSLSVMYFGQGFIIPNFTNISCSTTLEHQLCKGVLNGGKQKFHLEELEVYLVENATE